MSMVTLRDKEKVLAMVGAGSTRRDQLLLSLARQTSWTTGQRALVDQLWQERQAQSQTARA